MKISKNQLLFRVEIHILSSHPPLKKLVVFLQAKNSLFQAAENSQFFFKKNTLYPPKTIRTNVRISVSPHVFGWFHFRQDAHLKVSQKLANSSKHLDSHFWIRRANLCYVRMSNWKEVDGSVVIGSMGWLSATYKWSINGDPPQHVPRKKGILGYFPLKSCLFHRIRTRVSK